MKGTQAAPKSVKSSKGTITKGKGKGKSSGGATKKIKEALDKEIRAECNSGGELDFFMHECLAKDTEFDFEQEELQELLWTFVKNGCCDDQVVRFLLEQGLELLDDGDETPLGWARTHKDKDVVRAVVKAFTRYNNFDYALGDNSVSKVNRLIENGANVNVGSDMFATALHHAAFNAVVSDDLTCLKLLLEAGAKERLAKDDHDDEYDYEFSKMLTPADDKLNLNEVVLTPTQYIQRKFGNDEDEANAVDRAVDLLYEYSSAGKHAAKLQAKLEAKIDLMLSRMQAS